MLTRGMEDTTSPPEGGGGGPLVVKRILNDGSHQFEVNFVCGTSGVGKPSLIKDVYQSQLLTGRFQHACVTVMLPLILWRFLRASCCNSIQSSRNMDVMDSSESKLGRLLDGKN